MQKDNQDTFLPVISYIYKTWNEFYKGPSVLSISYGADEYEFGYNFHLSFGPSHVSYIDVVNDIVDLVINIVGGSTEVWIQLSFSSVHVQITDGVITIRRIW